MYEYSDSDVEPHAKDIKEEKKRAAAKVFSRVRTTLSKPYNAGDDKLRVLEKCGAKKGMRMKITHETLNYSEKKGGEQVWLYHYGHSTPE